MARVHLVGGEKGGVGKSPVARLLAQYFIDRSMPSLGSTPIKSHGALVRFCAGYASPVVVDRFESLGTLVEAAAEDPERRVLVDLAAPTYHPRVRWMDESALLDLQESSASPSPTGTSWTPVGTRWTCCEACSIVSPRRRPESGARRGLWVPRSLRRGGARARVRCKVRDGTAAAGKRS